MQRWCNGSIEVSKTSDPGSNPGLCVLSRTLTRKAYIHLDETDFYAESAVGSIPTTSATCSLKQPMEVETGFSNLYAIDTFGAEHEVVERSDFQSDD